MFTTNIINYFFFFDKAGCTRCFFSKTHQSSLTLKGGSTSHLGLLPSGKKRKPLLLVARNHFILWLADRQRSSPAAELHFAVCDRMDTNRLRAAERPRSPTAERRFLTKKYHQQGTQTIRLLS